MLDNYYMSTAKAHKQKPLQSRIRMAWFGVSIFLAIVWTSQVQAPYREKKCYFDEVENKVVFDVNAAQLENGTVVDVSSQFEQTVQQFLVQTYIMVFQGMYWFTALYVMPFFLKFRHFVSMANKINLAFGSANLFCIHFYRLSAPGQACSGDWLTKD